MWPFSSTAAVETKELTDERRQFAINKFYNYRNDLLSSIRATERDPNNVNYMNSAFTNFIGIKSLVKSYEKYLHNPAIMEKIELELNEISLKLTAIDELDKKRHPNSPAAMSRERKILIDPNDVSKRVIEEQWSRGEDLIQSVAPELRSIESHLNRAFRLFSDAIR